MSDYRTIGPLVQLAEVKQFKLDIMEQVQYNEQFLLGRDEPVQTRQHGTGTV